MNIDYIIIILWFIITLLAITNTITLTILSTLRKDIYILISDINALHKRLRKIERSINR